MHSSGTGPSCASGTKCFILHNTRWDLLCVVARSSLCWFQHRAEFVHLNPTVKSRGGGHDGSTNGRLPSQIPVCCSKKRKETRLWPKSQPITPMEATAQSRVCENGTKHVARFSGDRAILGAEQVKPPTQHGPNYRTSVGMVVLLRPPVGSARTMVCPPSVSLLAATTVFTSPSSNSHIP